MKYWFEMKLCEKEDMKLVARVNSNEMVKIQILIRLIIYNKKLTKKELMTIVINTCQLMTKISNNKTEIKKLNKAKQKYLNKYL